MKKKKSHIWGKKKRCMRAPHTKNTPLLRKKGGTRARGAKDEFL